MKERDSGQPTSKDAFLDLKQKSLSALRKGLNASFRLGGAATLFLAACAEARPTGNGQTPISEPVPATSTIDTTPPATDESLRPAVAVDSPTPEVTPTVDIESLPMSEVAQMYAEGKVDYPAHWEDEKLNEFSRALAEYVNENVVADRAFVPLNHMGFDDLQVGWDPVDKKWHSSHHSSETTDFTGESLPELVAPGYTNSEGQEVIVDPQTGQETIVPKITLPELGEVTLSQLYLMGQSGLKNYVTNLMSGTPGLPDSYDGYIQQTRNNRFALPFVMEKNITQNEAFYNTTSVAGTIGSEIPDKDTFFYSNPTNSVLMPILDNETNEVIMWLRIQQGTQIKTHSFDVETNGNISWQYTNDRGTPIGFAGEPSLTPAIAVVGNTTAITYEQFGTSRNWLLEHGKEGGIGSEAELRQLLLNKSVQELMSFLSQLRLLAIRPDIIIYQGQ